MPCYVDSGVKGIGFNDTSLKVLISFFDSIRKKKRVGQEDAHSEWKE